MDWEEMGVSRYRIHYDEKTKVFRILDVWNESIKNIPESELDKDIPDNSPALKILSSEEISSLLECLKNLGWLDKFVKVENMPNINPMTLRKSIQEIAIENISLIAQKDVNKTDPNVSKEGILAIREIIGKL